ncbi:MAG: hypothetical protein J6Q39_07965 [Bacteroidales bacterium]|nr:hypothetical protein [Bacteroidales bacterium]
MNDVQIRFAKNDLRDALGIIADIKTDFVVSEVREAIFQIKDHIIGALELLEE